MIGVNHALAGGLLAKYLPLPVAIPLALASHFVMDALPHYGIPHSRRNRSRFWKLFFITDFLITLGFAVWQIYYGHYASFLGGLAGVCPDFIWVGQVIKNRSFKLDLRRNRFVRWHARIQLWEQPWGLWIELPLAVVMFYLVFLRS